MCQGIGIIVEVPIQAKMDDDDEDLTCFHFGSSQESELDPTLVLDSVWDCPGIILDTFIDDDGKTVPGWQCSYCLIPSNHDGSRFFKQCNASKALSALGLLANLKWTHEVKGACLVEATSDTTGIKE